VVVWDPHGGPERALEAVAADRLGEAVRVLADIGAAARKPRFGIGDEPPFNQDGAQQLSLRA
jgi:hypothetical protein